MHQATEHHRKGPWFVVDMTNRWKKHLIKRGKKPTKVYKVFANVVKEAHRLAVKYPGHEWGVFECVGFLKADDQPKE